MPITVLRKTTTLTTEGAPMPKIRINDTDEIEAQKAVLALQRQDEKAFRAVVDDAFQRYGGIERMMYVLTSQLAKANQ